MGSVISCVGTALRRIVNTIYLNLIYPVFSVLPATRFFALKRLLLRMAGAKVGNHVKCVSSARFWLAGRLNIGENVWIGHEVLVVGGDASVEIGARCDIAPRVTIATGSHRIDADGPRIAGEGYSLPVKIADGCWIGTGATVLGGTVIGTHSIVAAGAVVRGQFPARSLIGGVPARVIRSIDDLPTQREGA